MFDPSLPAAAACVQLGPVAPFNASAVVLLVGGAGIATLWTENYGDNRHRHTIQHQFEVAFAAIVSSEYVVVLSC